MSERPDGQPQGDVDLQPESVIVRGGLMKRIDLQTSAATYQRETQDGYALSFWSWPGMSAEEIALRVGSARLPHPVIRESTVERLSNTTGLHLEPSSSGHVRLRLPDPPADYDFELIRKAFDRPRPNPVAARRGGAL